MVTDVRPRCHNLCMSQHLSVTSSQMDVKPHKNATTDADPWVSDLDSSFAPGDCQSTVGFDIHPCDATPKWYVEIEIDEYAVANPRWEGKLCNSCLSGWLEWAAEEPHSVRVMSVNPIVRGT